MIPEIKTKNIKPIIRKRIEEITEKLKSKPEVEGIVYLGGLANTEYKDFIEKFTSKLNELERNIFEGRFFKEKTQSALAKELDI